MGTILIRISDLAHDFLRTATTVEQKSVATELLDLTAALDADAMAGEINQAIARALEIAGTLNPYCER